MSLDVRKFSCEPLTSIAGGDTFGELARGSEFPRDSWLDMPIMCTGRMVEGATWLGEVALSGRDGLEGTEEKRPGFGTEEVRAADITELGDTLPAATETREAPREDRGGSGITVPCCNC